MNPRKLILVLLLCVALIAGAAGSTFLASANGFISDRYNMTVYNGNYIWGIPANTMVSELMSTVGGSTVLKSALGEQISSISLGLVCTGYKFNDGANEYALVVRGDVNGDGIADSSDYVSIKRHFRGAALNDAFVVAADVNGDGVVSSADYLRFALHLKGKLDIFEDIYPIESSQEESSYEESSYEESSYDEYNYRYVLETIYDKIDTTVEDFVSWTESGAPGSPYYSEDIAAQINGPFLAHAKDRGSLLAAECTDSQFSVLAIKSFPYSGGYAMYYKTSRDYQAGTAKMVEIAFSPLSAAQMNMPLRDLIRQNGININDAALYSARSDTLGVDYVYSNYSYDPQSQDLSQRVFSSAYFKLDGYLISVAMLWADQEKPWDSDYLDMLSFYTVQLDFPN